jgi:hypothetical protein
MLHRDLPHTSMPVGECVQGSKPRHAIRRQEQAGVYSIRTAPQAP